VPSRKPKVAAPASSDAGDRLAALASDAPVAGISGPGRWLIAEYQPTALFSLKMGLATSSVGKTLIIPTPYAIKMALVDAAFRAGNAGPECEALLKTLVFVDARIAPGLRAVVTHTFVKVRQEPKLPNPREPYIAAIAYREFVHHPDVMRWAFDLSACDDLVAGWIVELLPHISYIGKRGSFIQFRGLHRAVSLGLDFTQALPAGGSWSPPPRAHIVPLDDFGPAADLETLSSFTNKRPKRDQHRRFVETIVPLGVVNSGPGFTEYGRG
jgi:hypothetical protein